MRRSSISRLARRLKRAGMRTVQYVSPQVWAWRQGRVRTIGAAGRPGAVPAALRDRVLRPPRRARRVRRPPARGSDSARADRAAARRALGLEADAPLVALLPGSRLGEVARLAAPFVAAAARIAQRRPATASSRPWPRRPFVRRLRGKSRKCPARLTIRLLDGQAQQALAAADAAIVASGTATLETLLSGRPMVVAYRVSAVTAFVLRTLGLVKVRYFSQPNLLAGRRLVPEFLQEQVQRRRARRRPA